MLTSQLHAFGFIIPSFLLCLGSGILWIGRSKHIAPYVRYFACVIVMAGILQIAQAIAIPQQMIDVLPWLCVWFLLAISLMTHSIYLRFKIRTHWPYVVSVIILSIPIFLYFTYIDYSFESRLSATMVATLLIFGNNLRGILTNRSQHWLDHLLKIIIILMLSFFVCQVMFLVLMANTLWLDAYVTLFWSSTQFTSLFFNMAIFSLLSGCAVHDSMRTLKYELSIDPLTGLFNRRALHEKQKLFRALPEAPYALLLCDLDHFKKINDQYGHAIGDLALQHVSQIMRTTLRQNNRIIRFGGEEFLVVLAAPADLALEMAECLRHNIYRQPLYLPEQEISITISIGVSFFDAPCDLEPALQDADLMLYQAKKMGRDQVAWQMAS